MIGKKTEETQSLLANMLKSIPDTVFIKNLQGTYLGCNEGLACFVDRRIFEIVGFTDYDLLSQES